MDKRRKKNKNRLRANPRPTENEAWLAQRKMDVGLRETGVPDMIQDMAGDRKMLAGWLRNNCRFAQEMSEAKKKLDTWGKEVAAMSIKYQEVVRYLQRQDFFQASKSTAEILATFNRSLRALAAQIDSDPELEAAARGKPPPPPRPGAPGEGDSSSSRSDQIGNSLREMATDNPFSMLMNFDQFLSGQPGFLPQRPQYDPALIGMLSRPANGAPAFIDTEKNFLDVAHKMSDIHHMPFTPLVDQATTSLQAMSRFLDAVTRANMKKVKRK